MPFKIERNGFFIKIKEQSDGDIRSFNDVCTEIINESIKEPAKKVLLYSDKDGETGPGYIIPGGLDRIYDRPTYEAILAEKVKYFQDKFNLEEAERTGDYSALSQEEVTKRSEKVIMTTSMFVAGRDIESEIEVVTAECAFGMNIFRDLFATVRDKVGGRSKAVEKVLKDGRSEAMTELRVNAFLKAADAVIAVNLEYVELSGGSKNGMLLVVATGTAVKLGRRL